METNIKKINIVTKDEIAVVINNLQDLLLFGVICNIFCFDWCGYTGRFFEMIYYNESTLLHSLKGGSIYMRISPVSRRISYGSISNFPSYNDYIFDIKNPFLIPSSNPFNKNKVKLLPFYVFYKASINVIKQYDELKLNFKREIILNKNLLEKKWNERKI